MRKKVWQPGGYGESWFLPVDSKKTTTFRWLFHSWCVSLSKKKNKILPTKTGEHGHLQNPTSKMCFFLSKTRLPLWCRGSLGWCFLEGLLLEVGCVGSLFRCRQPIGLVEVEVLSQIGATSRTGWEGCEKTGFGRGLRCVNWVKVAVFFIVFGDPISTTWCFCILFCLILSGW